MSEVKDPAIKLFGKTIPVPEISAAEAAKVAVRDSVSGDSDEERVGTEEEGVEKLSSSGRRTHDSRAEDGAEDGSESMMSENQVDPQLSALPKESSGMDSEADLGKDSKVEDGQEEKSNPQDKTLKKPDKILPCPRCNSMDTKFCYYNNYNVNQPRHFCKSCQRYWTAGGSMRNVAVGAGRRKNKNSVSQCRSSDNIPNGIYHPAQNSNGAVLTFGTDSPLCESMAAVLSIAERIQGAVDVKTAHPYGTVDDTSSAPKEEAGEKQIPQMLPFQMPPLQMPPQMVPFPGAPWPYPWVPVQWSPQTVQTVPTAFCPPGFQMGFYPAAPPTIPVPYWGCPMPGGWGLPWINPPLTPTSGPHSPSTGPLSPSLGKHPRDDSMLNPVSDRPEEPRKERVIESDPEKCLYVPKTLRINNPKEAAKSSIWETLGIKDDPVDSPGASLFKAAFPSKVDEKAHVTEASSVLQANPAAHSRSITFHERS